MVVGLWRGSVAGSQSLERTHHTATILFHHKLCRRPHDIDRPGANSLSGCFSTGCRGTLDASSLWYQCTHSYGAGLGTYSRCSHPTGCNSPALCCDIAIGIRHHTMADGLLGEKATACIFAVVAF